MAIHRILYLNHVGLVAGAERSLLAMIQALDRSRYEAHAICPPGPLSDLLARSGVEVRNYPLQRFHRTRNPLRLFSYALSAFHVALRTIGNWTGPRVDLVHSNSTTAHFYGVILAGFLRAPCVWHVRDLVPLGTAGRLLHAGSSAVVATSQAVAAVVRPPAAAVDKVRVIPNGIDVEAAAATPDPRIRAALGVSESAPLLAVMGQLVPWKCQDVFLSALPSVIRRWPHAVALIVGDDLFGDNASYKSELVNLTRHLGLEKNVTFLGWREDAAAILRACDLVVVPSRAEPFGRVALEAMAAGKPVVGTRAGGLPDVVVDGETGRLVPPDDPAALGKAITDLLWDRKLAQRMGEAGRRRVAEHFDIRATTRQIERLYDELLSRPAGRR